MNCPCRLYFERTVPIMLCEQSRSKFCANRPSRIVPGGTGFCANGPGARRNGCRQNGSRRNGSRRNGNTLIPLTKLYPPYPYPYSYIHIPQPHPIPISSSTHNTTHPYSYPILPLLEFGQNYSRPKWPRAETTHPINWPKRPRPKRPGRNEPGPKRPGFVLAGAFLSVAWPAGVQLLVFVCSSVSVVLFDTPGISRWRSQHVVSVESSSLFYHSIYLWFICFPWQSIDELENLYADRTTVCFEPWLKPRARLGSRKTGLSPPPQ